MSRCIHAVASVMAVSIFSRSASSFGGASRRMRAHIAIALIGLRRSCETTASTSSRALVARRAAA